LQSQIAIRLNQLLSKTNETIENTINEEQNREALADIILEVKTMRNALGTLIPLQSE
jgi:hypothetical protein